LSTVTRRPSQFRMYKGRYSVMGLSQGESMKAAAIAALGLLIVLPAHARQHHRASNLPTPTCDNDGRCTTFNARVAPIYSDQTNRKKTHAPMAVSTATKPATTAPPVSNPEAKTSEAIRT